MDDTANITKRTGEALSPNAARLLPPILLVDIVVVVHNKVGDNREKPRCQELTTTTGKSRTTTAKSQGDHT